MRPVARIRSDFPEKFGIPRQSGVVESLEAKIVFVPEFRVMDAVRGLEDFSHIWLIWEFGSAATCAWAFLPRAPRFARTRSGSPV